MRNLPQNTTNFHHSFGMSMQSYSNIEFIYSYGMNTQEKDDEIYGKGNSYSAEYWQYDARLGRRWNVDPVVKFHESPYAAFANNPIWFVDLNGGDTVYFFDAGTNPSNRRVYTATIYVVKNGVIHGPYSGSTYPNDPDKHNTAQEGTHLYNNRYGHKGGTKKGLNIVDESGNRYASGTSPEGKDITMTYVNVHSGVPPENNNDRHNRGSEGCFTILPKDADKFFSHFTWTNSSETTGTSTGFILVYREGENAESIQRDLEIRQGLQSPTDLPVVEGIVNNNTNTYGW